LTAAARAQKAAAMAQSLAVRSALAVGALLLAAAPAFADESQDHFAAGFEALRDENYPVCVTEFTRGLEARDDYMAFYYRGICDTQVKNTDQCIADFNRAGLDPALDAPGADKERRTDIITHLRACLALIPGRDRPDPQPAPTTPPKRR